MSWSRLKHEWNPCAAEDEMTSPEKIGSFGFRTAKTRRSPSGLQGATEVVEEGVGNETVEVAGDRPLRLRELSLGRG